VETCILAVGVSWKTFPSGDIRRGSCDLGEKWATRSGLRCFAVPPFPILPAACGDAQAAFVLQFVCVKTANQLRPAITGVTCVSGCTMDRGIFNSVNELWRSFFGVTPSQIGVRPLEDAALARLRLVFAFKTVVVGFEKCNWVKLLQRGDEEVEVVGVEGME